MKNENALYESIMNSIIKLVDKLLNEEIEASDEKAKVRQAKIEKAFALKLQEWFKNFYKHIRKFTATNKNFVKNNHISKEDWDKWMETISKIKCIPDYIQDISNLSVTTSVSEETQPIENKDTLYYIIKDLEAFDKIINAVKRTKLTSENENFQKILDLAKDFKKHYHVFRNIYNKHMEDNDTELDVKELNSLSTNNSNSTNTDVKNILVNCIQMLNGINEQSIKKLIYDLEEPNVRLMFPCIFNGHTYFLDVYRICEDEDMRRKINSYCLGELEKIQLYLRDLVLYHYGELILKLKYIQAQVDQVKQGNELILKKLQ